MEKQRIYIASNVSELDKEERFELCRLLIKAGYAVKFDRERTDKGKYIYFVEISR